MTPHLLKTKTSPSAYTPDQASRIATIAGLMLAFIVSSGTSLAGPAFTQFTDLLQEKSPLAGQEGWALRSAEEVSPVVSNFLGRSAIVVPEKDNSAPVVAAQLHLEPNNIWHVGRSFTLEFDLAFSDMKSEQVAMVGIGWTGGGIPAQVGLTVDRVALRQRHFGDIFYGREADGSMIHLEPGQWARIRATFTRESESLSPTISMSIAKDFESQDFHPVYFETNGAVVESLPIANDTDADLYQNMNLIWLRVKADAAIADISLANE